MGLDFKEVEISRNKYGNNSITASKKNSFLSLLLESFGDPIIRILLIALAIKLVFFMKNFDWYETIGIVIAIFLASFISTISEYGSEKAFIKLQEESSKLKAKVYRDNKLITVNIDDIVVGDIVLLESGDMIPADGILIEGTIEVNESSINGETKEAVKTIYENTLYRGTTVYSKRGKMKVTSVGNNTFYGKLSLELQEKKIDSPLKIRLRKLASIISKLGYIASFLVSFSYLFKVIVIDNGYNINNIINTITNFRLMFGYILYALTLTVTVIVVAVPEGLPMMITLVLSSNMKRMLKNNVLVRKLVGIETSGNINILFTDKTGTLTNGKLEVIDVIDGDLNHYYNKNEIKNRKYYDILKLSMVGNNDSFIENNVITGSNITDRALLGFFMEEVKINKNKVVPFDSKNKYSITYTDNINLIKGAPEKILPYVTNYYDNLGNIKKIYSKSKINSLIDSYTKRGIRVILVGTFSATTRSITLVGIILIKDEIRKNIKESIQLVKSSGIQTVMITGDNKDTAYNIANEIGLIEKDSLVLTSDELDKMTDEEVKQKLSKIRVVARALPIDKSRLVRLSQEMDLVVGMTGDGVNDAPALKKADIGFAMGSGTEVAKEAADIVILDDNFKSITSAILYGRTIFKSIRKFIIFQLTVNLCAVSLSIIGPFIGVGVPVTVIQMLWINMVMDTLAGLAFSYEPALTEYMHEKPKNKNEHIINSYMLNEILFTGIYSSLLCIFFLKSKFINSLFRPSPNNIYLMTAFFGLFIFISIFNSFNARTNRLNILSNLIKNRVFIFIISLILVIQLLLIYYGGTIFRTSGLTLKELFIMILISSTVIPVDFIRRYILKKKGINTGI